MINLGNRKLGFRVWQWSVPAGITCPGKSGLCEMFCYGLKGRLASPKALEAHKRNLILAEQEGFVDWMSTEIRRVSAEYFRPHVVGDFHEPWYAVSWLSIMTKCPKTDFGFYTRSWRLEEILPILRRMARLPNVFMWFSCDRETGAPPRVGRVRRAYMMVDDDDPPRFKVDLVFRDKTKTVMRHAAGNFVCPYDHGDEKRKRWTCSKCLLCYKDVEIPSRWQKTRNSLSPQKSKRSTTKSAISPTTRRLAACGS